jgi:hypothetical protein
MCVVVFVCGADLSILKMPFVTSVMSLRNLWRRKSDSSSSPVESKHAAAAAATADGGHDKVVECILQSPLLSICNMTEKDVKENVSKYMDIASHMIQSMGMPDRFEDMSVPDRCVGLWHVCMHGYLLNTNGCVGNECISIICPCVYGASPS